MLKLAFLNLFRRKSRTVLALTAITIGIGALVTMIAVVDGTFLEFEEMVAKFQGVSVWEKDAVDTIFSTVDAGYGQKLERIQGVRSVVPELYRAPATIDGNPALSASIMSPAFVYGVDIDKFYAQRGQGFIIAEVDKGAKLRSNDSGSVLIGEGLAEDYDKFVGGSIKIDGEKFRIKGILKETSEAFNNVILMNLDDSKTLFGLDEDKVGGFYLDLQNPEDDKKIADLVNFRFETDLEAWSSSDLSEQFGSVLGSFRLAVFLIAVIAAVVAGIGIINTMLMSVLERTKEIGALKAVGWTSQNVMKMILFESAVVGVVGGFTGVAFGVFGSMALSQVVGLQVAITPLLLLESFVFAVLLGFFAGVYPAYRASKLDPIDALRS